MEVLKSQSPSRWRILGLSALVILVFEALGIILGTFIGGFFMIFSVLFVSKSIQIEVIFQEIRKIDSEIYMLTIYA